MKYYCAKLLKSMSVLQDGLVSPCCVPGFCDPNLHIKNQSLEEVWNSSQLMNYRKEMLEGKPLDICHVCYKLEEEGVPSFRILANKLLKASEEEIDNCKKNNGRMPIESLNELNLRLSNLCDFKCRTCGPHNSSAWIKDAKALEPIKNYELINLKNVNPTFIDSFKKMIPHLNYVYFAGGEPLITPEHYELLDYLLPYADKITLDYNTNLTTLNFKNYDLISIWKKFKLVRVGISLDDEGKRVELIRKGIDYQRTLSLHKELLKHTDNIFPYVYVTINVLNIFYLPEAIDDWLKNKLIQWPDQLALTVLSEPKYLNPKILNQEERERLAKKYNEHLANKKNKLNPIIFKMLERTLKYTLSILENEYLADQREEFKKWTKNLDGLRNENSKDLFRELHSVLD